MSDQERIEAARAFVFKATVGRHLTAKEFDCAVKRAAEALPPFTRIKGRVRK